jgi:hypothetical protein
MKLNTHKIAGILLGAMTVLSLQSQAGSCAMTYRDVLTTYAVDIPQTLKFSYGLTLENQNPPQHSEQSKGVQPIKIDVDRANFQDCVELGEKILQAKTMLVFQYCSSFGLCTGPVTYEITNRKLNIQYIEDGMNSSTQISK